MSAYNQKPKVLFFIDEPNWAFDLKTQNLEHQLGNKYTFLRRYKNSETTEADLDHADLIVSYSWNLIVRMSHLESAIKRNRCKILIGVCYHTHLEGEWRELTLAALRKLPAGVFVNNMLLYREIQSLLDVPTFYTPNGVNINFFHPNSIFIKYSRNIYNRIKKRSKKIPGLRVGWAGYLTGYHGPKLRGFYDLIVPGVRSVKDAELVTAIREEKWRCKKEMRQFYRSLDVYLCASLTEGTPNPCLEAAACGVPVVTTRVGNMPELIQHGTNGLFVERDVADIVSKITMLRDNPNLRASISRAMITSIQAWDWKHQAENYRTMFNTILNGQTL